jgi:glycine/D-amino acid oxidase-like deaminating enzyme
VSELANRFDILVIGAGIMGVASAYHLKKNNPGRSMLLIDRYGAPGQGNTGRSNAMYRNTFSSSDNQVLANCSIDFYQSAQSEGWDVGLQQIGYLWLMTNEGVSKSEPFVSRMEKNGISVRRYTGDELRSMMPGMKTSFDGDPEAALMGLGRVDGGLFGPKCGRLDPDKLVRFYIDKYTKLGGKMTFNTNVDRLNFSPSEELGIDGEPLVWQDAEIEGVHASGAINGDITAGVVVLACGAWGNELLEPAGFDGHTKAKKRQLFSVPAHSDSLVKLLHTKGFNDLGLLPMVILPKSGVHFKPVSDENDFWVACEDDLNQPYINIPSHDLESYRAEEAYFANGIHPILRAYFPDFAGSRPRSMWAGLYSYNTLDFLPFAFREGNLIVVGGDSGSGIMKGDSLGRVVDSLYRDEEETMLCGNVPYRTSKISFDHRDVEREEWVL